MTTRGVSEILQLFQAAYRVEFAPDEIKAWHLLLAPISDDDGRRAAIELCQKSPFIPKPADIFRLFGEWREAQRVPPWRPALPEPQNPELARRYLSEIRGQITKLAEKKAIQ